MKDAKLHTDVKTIRSFGGLCNFFRMHIKNFAIITAPLFKLTRKDSGYKGGPLPKEAMAAFPREDRQYALIMDAATGTADTPGGLGAILTNKRINTTTTTPSLMPCANSKITKKIIHLSYWSQLQQFGAWMPLMNT